MEMLSKPLAMTEAENRAALAAQERNMIARGNEFGNRQQRRLAARIARKERRKEGVTAND